jgi:hypothetical protein
MKTYTIYDNANGGFTIWYQYFDRYENRYVKKAIHFEFKNQMLNYKKKLEDEGYRFVGKI